MQRYVHVMTKDITLNAQCKLIYAFYLFTWTENKKKPFLVNIYIDLQLYNVCISYCFAMKTFIIQYTIAR